MTTPTTRRSAADMTFMKFHRKFMGKIGVIEGTDEVVRIAAVMLPVGAAHIEPVTVTLPEVSPDDPSLVSFPAGEFEGIGLKYRSMDLHLRLID